MLRSFLPGCSWGKRWRIDGKYGDESQVFIQASSYPANTTMIWMWFNGQLFWAGEPITVDAQDLPIWLYL